MSVLMTAYNREKYIGEAINSVMASTYGSFELIIVDDCSKDQTYQIAKQFADADDRVTVYRNEKNLGQFENRNKAATFARGRYIKYVDSDDTISSNALSMMVQSMEGDPQVGIGLVCNCLNGATAAQGMYKYLEPGKAFLWHYYNGGILFPGPTGCIFRKELFDKVGGFPLDLGINGDLYLNLKMAAVSNVVLFPGSIVFWRKHKEQVDELQQDYVKMHKERFFINKRILNEKNPLKKDQLLKRVKLTCKVLFIRGAVKNILLRGNLRGFQRIMKEANLRLVELPLILIPLRLVNPLKKFGTNEV